VSVGGAGPFRDRLAWLVLAEQVKGNAAAAGKSLASETLAGIDEALGDAVERDGSLVGNMSPKQRLT
jgi:hypothetical protein